MEGNQQLVDISLKWGKEQEEVVPDIQCWIPEFFHYLKISGSKRWQMIFSRYWSHVLCSTCTVLDWKCQLCHAALSFQERNYGRGSASLGRVLVSLLSLLPLWPPVRITAFFSMYKTNENHIMKSLYKAKRSTVAFKYCQLRRVVKYWFRDEKR